MDPSVIELAKDEFVSKAEQNGHQRLLKVMDQCFGVYTLGMSAVLAFAAFNGQVTWKAVIGQLVYPGSHLFLSQIAFRLKRRRKLEIFRTVFSSCVLSPIGFLLVDGVLDQYWTNFLLTAIAGPILVSSSSSNIQLSRALVILNTFCMFVTVALTSKSINWYSFVTFTGLALMLGLFIVQTLEVLMLSFRREHIRALELVESQKLVFTQHQALLATSKMSALGEMAGGVAHEINNPLAILQMLAYQLKKAATEEVKADKLQSMAEKVLNTTQRISKIVKALRTFSRDAHQDAFVSSSIKQAIDDVLILCNEQLKQSGIELIVEGMEIDVSIQMNATEISQALASLITNAKEAVLKVEEKWIKLSLSESHDLIEIRVTDSGHGISDEIRGKVFQPFFTTKDVGEGAGLGLSVALGIARQHEGDLVLDNDSVHTCFVLSLPKSQAARLGLQTQFDVQYAFSKIFRGPK